MRRGRKRSVLGAGAELGAAFAEGGEGVVHAGAGDEPLVRVLRTLPLVRPEQLRSRVPHLLHLAVAVLALAVEQVVRARTHLRLPPLRHLLQPVHYDEPHVLELRGRESSSTVYAWGLVLARPWHFVLEADLDFCGQSGLNCKVAALDGGGERVGSGGGKFGFHGDFGPDGPEGGLVPAVPQTGGPLVDGEGGDVVGVGSGRCGLAREVGPPAVAEVAGAVLGGVRGVVVEVGAAE